MSILYWVLFVIFITLIIFLFRSNKKLYLITMLTLLTFQLPSLPWEVVNIPSIAMITFISVNIFIIAYTLLLKDRTLISKNSSNMIVNYLLVISLLVVSLTYSKNIESGVDKIIFFIVRFFLPLISFSFLKIQKDSEKKAVLIGIIFGGILLATKLITEIDLTIGRLGESPLTISRNIGMAALLLLLLLHFNTKQLIIRFIYIFVLGFLLYIILLTGSRGPIVFLVLTYIIYIYLFNKNKKLKFMKILLFSLTLIFVLSYIYLNTPSIQISSIDRIINTLVGENTESATESINIRLSLYRISIKGFIESYFIGIGNGSFNSYISNTNFSNQLYPHNIFIEMLVELGIFGGILFILILSKHIGLVKEKFNSFNTYSLILSSVALYGLFNAMVSGDISKNIYFSGLILLVCTYDYRNNKTHVIGKADINARNFIK